MTTADTDRITSSPPGALGFMAAAMPSRRTEVETPLAALHRDHAAISKRHAELDERMASIPPGAAHDAADEELDDLLDQALALQASAAKFPAQTLGDAAIQATFAFYRIEGLTPIDDDDRADIEDIRAFLASIILLLTEGGRSLSIDDLGWGEMRRLCALRAPTGSAAA